MMREEDMVAEQSLTARIRAMSETQRALLALRLGTASGVDTRKTGGEQRLLAFLTTYGTAVETDEAAIREKLAERVPAHMVPVAVHIVNGLPRLPNGKVDAKSLLGLAVDDGGAAPSKDAWIEPRTPVERTLAEIWRELLQIDEISINDDFFELGGDSILSITFVSKATQRGLSFAPNDIFNFPTIAGLGARCRSEDAVTSPDGGGPHSDGSDVHPASPRQAVKPLFIVDGGVAVVTVLREQLGSKYPVYTFKGHWEDADINYWATVSQLARQRLEELRSLQPLGPYLISGYSMGALIAFEMAQQLRASGDQVDLLVLIDPPSRSNEVPKQKDGEMESAPIESDATSTSVRHSGSAFARHWRKATQRGWFSGMNYILREARAQFGYRVARPLKGAWGVHFQPRVVVATASVCRAIRISVPQSIRERYVGEVYRHAWGRYEPAAYAGEIVLFLSTDRRAGKPTVWEQVAEGNLVTEWFEGEHLDFAHNPRVRKEWGKRLAEFVVSSHTRM